MITIFLDSVRKQRNKSEWRTINRAWCIRADGSRLECAGDGQNIRNLCRLLLLKGVRGMAMVKRGQTDVFSQPIGIAEFAADKWGRGEQPEHLRRPE